MLVRRARLLAAGLSVAALAACGSSASSASSGKSAQPAPSRPTAGSTTPAPSSASPTPKPTTTPTPSPQPRYRVTPPLRVEVWGDSIPDQAKAYLAYAFDGSGKAVAQVHTYGGTALCDWLNDIRKETNPADPTAFHPQAAVISFSGDAFTPCMHDANNQPLAGQALVDKYAADSAAAIGIFTAAKIPVYFAAPPLTRGDAKLGYVGLTPMGVMFSKLPSKFPGNPSVNFLNAGAAVLRSGHYTDTLPCQPGEICNGQWPDGTKTVLVRQADGGHFCPVKEVLVDSVLHCPVPMPGARRFAMAVADPILRDFGLA